MNNVVNLNKFRKEKQQNEKAQQADESRRKFGRTKAEKTNDDQNRNQFEKSSDGHKLDDDKGA